MSGQDLFLLFDRYFAVDAIRLCIPMNIYGMVSLALMNAVVIRSSEIG
jgi:hypothetical protein